MSGGAWSGDYAAAPLSDDEQVRVSSRPGQAQLEQRLLSARPITHQSRAHVLIIIATLALVIVVWWLIPPLGLMKQVLISTPLDTLQGLWSLLTTGSLVTHFAFTMAQVVGGFIAGVLIGLMLGTALALSSVLHRIFAPYILALRSLPVIVLAPLFIAWFGFGVESKIATAVTICFLPTMINTMVGLRLPTEESLALMRALRASAWQVYRKVRVPTAMPLIFVGLKHSLLLSFTGVLLAEILLGGSTQGLGTLIRLYSSQIRMDLVFAVVIVVTSLSVLLVMVFDWLDRRLIFWREN